MPYAGVSMHATFGCVLCYTVRPTTPSFDALPLCRVISAAAMPLRCCCAALPHEQLAMDTQPLCRSPAQSFTPPPAAAPAAPQPAPPRCSARSCTQTHSPAALRAAPAGPPPPPQCMTAAPHCQQQCLSAPAAPSGRWAGRWLLRWGRSCG